MVNVPMRTVNLGVISVSVPDAPSGVMLSSRALLTLACYPQMQMMVQENVLKGHDAAVQLKPDKGKGRAFEF